MRFFKKFELFWLFFDFVLHFIQIVCKKIPKFPKIAFSDPNFPPKSPKFGQIWEENWEFFY